MRSIEEITKDLDRAQRDHNTKSSLIRMLEPGTPEHELKPWRDEMKPIEERLQQLKAELREAS
jgi:hypothetical protein